MIRFSANLGLLWADMALPDAIRAAARAGFDAVECHFPYATPPAAVRRALAETGLAMLGLNTRPGDRARGEFGLAALPGREAEARAAIDAAVTYAGEIDAGYVHVMAGRAADPVAARAVLRDNLARALELTEGSGLALLLEPLNPRSVPGYALPSLEAALEVRAALDHPRLGILFDCFHLQIAGGDLVNRFREVAPHVGHVQFAGVPDRGEPDTGEVDYRWLLPRLREAGHDAPFGAEYVPRGAVEAGLGWMARLRGG